MLEYFERRATTYREDSNRGLWRRVRAVEFAACTRLLDLSPGMSLLELGCGAGVYLIPLMERFGLNVFGVDSSPAMLLEVRRKNIPTWLGQAEEMPDLGSFDRILAAGLLEFVEKPELVMERAVRQLRRPAKLVLLVPAAGVRGQLYKAAHEWRGCPVFIRTIQEYTALASRFGLTLGSFENCTPISVALSFDFPRL